jgi:hypothetical protein
MPRIPALLPLLILPLPVHASGTIGYGSRTGMEVSAPCAVRRAIRLCDPCGPCHTRGMVSYTVTPRGRSYWLEAIDNDGSRRQVERFDTEDLAVQRLRVLNEKEGVEKPKRDPIPGWSRH